MIVKGKCPNCGKIIDFEENDFNVICKFCGVPFMPKEGIDNYKKYIEHNVMVEDVNLANSEVKNYSDLGYASLKEGNREKCGFYAEDILKNNPRSPQGLLLEGYYLSSSVSKEKGIDDYFLAYSLFKKQEDKDLLVDTFIKEFNEYSSENFTHFFDKLFHYEKPVHDVLLDKALETISINEDEKFYEDINVSEKDLNKYYKKANTTLNTEEYLIKQFDDKFIIFKNGIFFKILLINNLKKRVEKFVSKKANNIITYNFYLNDDKIITFKLNNNCPELDNLFAKHFEINAIKEGCYIATCVYGSYNCQNVKVLRNFRDQCLRKNLLGRLFISLYYFVSPTIVSIFYKNKLFNKINKVILDHIVLNLKEKGYSSNN